MTRNALSKSEFTTLAAAIGSIGDVGLRAALALEVAEVLNRHNKDRSGRAVKYDWPRWQRLCDVSGSAIRSVRSETAQPRLFLDS